MRNTKLYLSIVTIAGLTSLTAFAQQPSTSQSGTQQAVTAGPMPASLQTNSAQAPSAPDKATQRAVPVPSTADAPEVHNSNLRPVQGELESKVDSTTAKPGDAVVVKTTARATTADGVVIPSGSKIVGKVVDAQPATSATQNAKVTVLFDRAQLKSGRDLPIKSVLQSVSPSEAAAAAAEPIGGEASSAPSARESAEASTAARPTASAPTPAPGSAPQANASSAPGSKSGNQAPEGTIVAKQGDVAIKTTAVSGVLIAANSDGKPFSNASGALLGERHNIHLDTGTHVVLAVAEVGTKGNNPR